jgi:hypothetical protein
MQEAALAEIRNPSDQTKEAAEKAGAQFEATRLSDQQWAAFRKHLEIRSGSQSFGCLNLVLVPLSVVAGVCLLAFVVGIFGLISQNWRIPSQSATLALAIKEPEALPRVAEPVIGLPNRKLTPGATVPGVTVEQLRERGYAKREHAKVTANVRRAVFERYGIPKSAWKLYTIDHLVSVETGGASELTNLWPQLLRCRYEEKFDAGSITKDALENRLAALVRAEQMPIAEAARAQSLDWISAYKKFVSPELPPWRSQYLEESE